LSSTLLNPAERDACGIGFVADLRGRASREIVDAALAGLVGMRHRGAVAADRRTGDGAGLLLPIPPALMPGPWCGLATVFLRDEAARAGIVDACRAEGIETLGWREVPVNPATLGEVGRASQPRIEQLVLLRPLGAWPDEAECRAHRARRRAARVGGAYVVSLSFRTVTYKALCAADQLAAFYLDLADPAVTAPFAIFHQRFSTNTAPSWERAQPFRLLCHNGEINAIDGTTRVLASRRRELEEDELGPALEAGGSDSSLLDNALELLVRSGRDVREAVAALVPAVDDRTHAPLTAPWDGPAGIVFTDGRVVGAALDRNGLRPLRYSVAGDVVACASEAGAVPLPEGLVRRRRLGPGEMLVVDPAGFGLEENELVRRRLARRVRTRRAEVLPVGEPVVASGADLTRRQVASGYTREDLAHFLRTAAGHGHEPVSSMGDDTALPPLAGRARPLFTYLRQRFAQVTNPPIDHLRERSVMSLRTQLGPRAPLFASARRMQVVELESFFCYPSALPRLEAFRLSTLLSGDESLPAACRRLADEAERAVAAGARVVLLSDERYGPSVPALLALGAVHQRLLAAGLRTDASLVVASDEPRESHHFACLLGFGADLICPRLALETVAELAAADGVGADRPDPGEAQHRFRSAVEDGVLKVMAKMGISDVASYRSAQLFDALGLAQEVVDLCLTGTPSPVGGIGFERLEQEVRARWEAAQAPAKLENPGYVKFRKGGEPHAITPDVVAAAHALRRAARGDDGEYEKFARLVNEREPLELRDLLEPVDCTPIALDEVEPASEIVRRFSGGAMSHGSLSAEAHETIAIALNRLGARSNSGEGGEDPARFRDERNSRIKQIASARFGVTPEYVAFAEELQIKIAQGSKPGEGGQLPGHKVTPEIARLRHTTAGVELISPPPHHDIYSIEDLAQLVFDLRQANPRAAVSVKLVSETGIGLVAAGVAKALADVVHVAGADGGTGASPLSSIKNAGLPWEIGLAETQKALVTSGLRGRIRVRADGGFKTGRDVVVAALLGADEFSFGTALLLAEGCLLVRSCHVDTCPVGIATQRPELRAKFAATPEMLQRYLMHVAEEARSWLARLGLRSIGEAVGRADLLRAQRSPFSLDALLRPWGGGYAREAVPSADGGELGTLLAAEALKALEEPRLVVEREYAIATRDRAVGARLGTQIAERYGTQPPPGRVRARFFGSAGQSFGAFLAAGIELALTGEANDYVGKGMGGGRIVVRPPADDAGAPVLLGNTALYGATGGELFCAGGAGERFAVRNSGAVAVVEGVGAHACEYMTGGTVVVLGSIGLNLGAGMSGGTAYVHDPGELLAPRLNGQLVAARRPDATALDALRALVDRHVRFTGSRLAERLLGRWDAVGREFWEIAPRVAAVATVPAEEDAA
jgi:glutamate synthase domain-containing protein 2/glutamate synthase domain-containing protein 1/glutamate synthase domain-containing protein 3